MIAIERVDVVFGRTVALDCVDVTLEPGITGLFGPNGSGKSTLLRVLAGLLAPSSGRAVIGGLPCHPPAPETRAITGYSGHSTGLYPDLTVAENLDLFAGLTGAGPERPAHVLDVLGLAGNAGERVRTLSAGLKRRVAVARALLHDPEVLLLDEPYANVDDDAAELISAAIVSWCRPGRTGVVATHGAKRVRPYATTSLVLRRGALAAHRALDGAQ